MAAEELTIRLHYRHGKGEFKFKYPLYIAYPETVYIDNSADITLGARVNISRDVTIVTHAHDFVRGVPVPLCPVESIPLEVGDDVFIGIGAIVCPEVRKIGTGAVIGAGSVVTKDVPDYEVWAGNPARKIGEVSGRDHLSETEDNLK